MSKILIAGEQGKTRNYEEALHKLGMVPVTALWVPDSSVYDGLVLPGGGDIDPRLFGQLPGGTRAFNPELDRIQLAILKVFRRERKPILGICKGMQLINIAFGGDMIQHLSTANIHEGTQDDSLHKSYAQEGSFLEQLYGREFVINSAHHQGVRISGRGIRYIQRAPDGIVEGLQHEFYPILGLQWHPERLCFRFRNENAVDGSEVFKFFKKLVQKT